MKTATAVTAKTRHRRSGCFMQRTLHTSVASRYPQGEMLGRTYDGQNCSVAKTLELVGERWTVLILREIYFGRRRFDEIADGLGIARNVLTQRLQRLVEEDVLTKVAYQERPQRFEYRLTDKGLDLWPVMVTMMQFGDRYYAPEGPPDRAHPPRLRRHARRPPHVHHVRRQARRQRRPRPRGPRSAGPGVATGAVPAPASGPARTGHPAAAPAPAPPPT